MSKVHLALAIILVIFAAVQYNDPDWYFWGPIYLLAAAWSYVAAWRPALFRTSPAVMYGALLSAALFLVGFVYDAPFIKSGWIHIEEAREAFGFLISAATSIFAVWDSRRRVTA